MSQRTFTFLGLVLGGLLAACSSGQTTSPTTGSGASSTTGAPPTSVSTFASFLQNGQCPQPPTVVAVDTEGVVYAVNGTLNIVQADGGINSPLPLLTDVVSVATSTAGLYISVGSPVQIETVSAFTPKPLAGGASGCADSIAGIDGGVGFVMARAIAADATDAVYVADWNAPGCTRIRKISFNGDTHTLSGTGNTGYLDGPGDTAVFHEPSGITVDGQRNVYVADSANNRIRLIPGDGGETTTIAGNGDAGFDDNSGPPNTPSSPTFNFPTGLALDASGNLYVADTLNNAIRVISPDGVTTTLAGNGTKGFVNGTLGQTGTAEFNYPLSVAVNKNSGDVYVADEGNCAIRVIKASPTK